MEPADPLPVSLPDARALTRRPRWRWRHAVALGPVVAAALAIHALWRLELDGPANPGWGTPGAAMAGLIVFCSLLAAAWLVGQASWRSALGGAAVAIVVVGVLAPARQRVHDDRAFARAADSPALVARYLAWGERHRAEADALTEHWRADQQTAELASRRQRVATERARLASARLDPAIARFFDAVLATAPDGELPRLELAVRDGKPAASGEPISGDNIRDGVESALRAQLPVALVSIVAHAPAVATVEVRYEVRPWLVAGAPVTFGEAGTIALGLSPRDSVPGIELVIDLRLVRPGAAPVELHALVHPPERFDAHSLALLVDPHGGERAIARAMAQATLAELRPAIERALASASAGAAPQPR